MHKIVSEKGSSEAAQWVTGMLQLGQTVCAREMELWVIQTEP